MTSTRSRALVWRRWGVSLAITCIFLGGLAWLVDPRALFTMLRHVPLGVFVSAVAAYIGVLFWRGIRIATLFSRFLDTPQSIVGGFRFATITTFSNHVLPFRLGDAVFVSMAQVVERLPLHQGAGLVFVMRAYDGIGNLILLAMGLGLVASAHSPALAWVASGLAILLLGIAVRIDWVFASTKRLLLPLLGNPGTITGWRARIAKLIDSVDQGMEFVRRPSFVAWNLVFAAGIWLTQSVFYFLILQAFGLPKTWSQVLLAAGATSMASLLPAGLVGSFGPMEAGWSAAFVAMGVPSEEAATSGLAMHLVAVGVGGCLSIVLVLSLVPRISQAIATRKSRHASQTNH